MNVVLVTIVLVVIIAIILASKRTMPSANPSPTASTRDSSQVEQRRGQGAAIKIKVVTRPDTPSEKEASELLKAATAKHNSGDTTAAIDTLRRAYALMASSPIIYPIETYLRLPLYLQKAGRYAEAMIEFENLLKSSPVKIAREFAHCKPTERQGLVSMENSAIHDKIRLACEREEKFELAVFHAILSHAERCLGLKYQKRGQELRTIKSKASWKEVVEDVSDTALKPRKEALLDACVAFSKEVSSEGLVVLTDEVKAIVSEVTPTA